MNRVSNPSGGNTVRYGTASWIQTRRRASRSSSRSRRLGFEDGSDIERDDRTALAVEACVEELIRERPVSAAFLQRYRARVADLVDLSHERRLVPRLLVGLAHQLFEQTGRMDERARGCRAVPCP